ncbi:MAG: fibronectin type III domain-containing protein [Candidatus Cloacimonetes bacterium]|nr:fibronectin type III domain-containing protein [Candidatus Cloacimonadota bacterium]
MKHFRSQPTGWLLLAALLGGCADALPTAPDLAPAPTATTFVDGGGLPIAGAADAFAGTSLNEDFWDVIAAPGRVVVDNRLELAVAPRAMEAIKLMYRDPQSFAGASFQTEISQYATGSATLGTFMAVTDANELSYVIFNAFNGQLTAWYRWAGAAPVQLSGSLPLDPVNHRFLRLREASGTVYYETSADGFSWTTRWTVQHAFPDIHSLHGMLGLQSWGTSASNPTAAHFEGVNTVAPAAPRSLAAVANAPLSIDLGWHDQSVNEAAFHVERRMGADTAFITIAELPANSSEYRDEGLVAGAVYEYRIRAIGPTGASSLSHTAEATALSEPPPVPPSVSTLVDSFDGTGINLDVWEVVGQPSSIVVDNRLELVTQPGVHEHVYARSRQALSFVGGSFFTEVSSFSGGTSTTETFMGIYSEDEEEYVAISVHNNRVTAWYKWRNQDNFVQLPGTLTLNTVQHRFLRIREAGGTVYLETSPNGLSWTTRWTVVHDFIDPHHLHAYIGVGTWGVPNSNPTPTYFEGVNTLVPASPRELSAVPAAEAIQLSWQDRSVNESGFRIERREAGVGSFTTIGSTAANVATYTDSGLVPGVEYEYRVRAEGASGNSAYTNTVIAAALEDNSPPPPPAPPVIATLTDAFAGTTLDLSLWTPRGEHGIAVNDQLQLSVAPNTLENIALMSVEAYRFQGSSFQVEIAQYAGGSANVGTYAAVTDAGELSYVIFNAHNGRLTAWRRWNGQSPVQIGSVTLDPTAHRYLRLREAAGRVYYETSPDGVTWTTRWNIAHSFADLDNLHGMIGVQSWGSPGSNPIPGIFASVGVIE